MKNENIIFEIYRLKRDVSLLFKESLECQICELIIGNREIPKYGIISFKLISV